MMRKGNRALRHYSQSRPAHENPPTDFILKLTEQTLKHNVFAFEDSVFISQEIKCTAMGAYFAPNYANLFLGQKEEEYVSNISVNPFYKRVKWWTRYIDDICRVFEST